MTTALYAAETTKMDYRYKDDRSEDHGEKYPAWMAIRHCPKFSDESLTEAVSASVSASFQTESHTHLDLMFNHNEDAMLDTAPGAASADGALRLRIQREPVAKMVIQSKSPRMGSPQCSDVSFHHFVII